MILLRSLLRNFVTLLGRMLFRLLRIRRLLRNISRGLLRRCWCCWWIRVRLMISLNIFYAGSRRFWSRINSVRRWQPKFLKLSPRTIHLFLRLFNIWLNWLSRRRICRKSERNYRTKMTYSSSIHCLELSSITLRLPLVYASSRRSTSWLTRSWSLWATKYRSVRSSWPVSARSPQWSNPQASYVHPLLFSPSTSDAKP